MQLPGYPIIQLPDSEGVGLNGGKRSLDAVKEGRLEIDPFAQIAEKVRDSRDRQPAKVATCHLVEIILVFRCLGPFPLRSNRA